MRWEGSLLVQLSPVHLCRARAQFGGVEGQKAMHIGRAWDWVSTCLPKPDSAPFPIQGHQIKPTKGRTCTLVLIPFTYLSYIWCPTPHILLLTAPFTLPGAITQNVDLAHRIMEITPQSFKIISYT